MRKASGAVAAMIMAIALYFTLSWGIDAVRVLTSNSYGLNDVWHSQYVFGVARIFHLGPMGIIKLAAFFGVMKLAAAAVFAIHIADRLRSMAGGGKPNQEIFEAGLILVALISLAAAVPGLWMHNFEIVQEQIVQLLLAGLATAMMIIERDHGMAGKPTEIATQPAAIAPKGATWFSPFR